MLEAIQLINVLGLIFAILFGIILAGIVIAMVNTADDAHIFWILFLLFLLSLALIFIK